AKAPAHTSGVATGRGTGRGPALRVTHSIMPTSPFPVRSRAGSATGAVGRPRGRSVSPAPIFPPPGRGGGSHAGRWLVPCAPGARAEEDPGFPGPRVARVPRGPRTPYVPRGPHPYGWPDRRRARLPAGHRAPNRWRAGPPDVHPPAWTGAVSSTGVPVLLGPPGVRPVRRRASGSVQRAASGPTTTRIRTYAVASGPMRGSVPTASPAMTMENSPRATSVP